MWQPKSQNQYIPIEYATNIDDGVFDFAHHGYAVFNPEIKLSDKERGDLIIFEKNSDKKELLKNIRLFVVSAQLMGRMKSQLLWIKLDIF